jgi:hypothetical protein
MLLGQTSRFTVKAKPGMIVAIAMADRDKGAKPIAGHDLRLGSDRKVVAISKIPDTGVAEIFVETPIEGDLIGQYLFFEAAVWSKADLHSKNTGQCRNDCASRRYQAWRANRSRYYSDSLFRFIKPEWRTALTGASGKTERNGPMTD